MRDADKGMYSVCAVDIVGFTRASDVEQRTMYQRLNDFVDELIAERDFLKVSTGDGLIISMWGSGPLEALELAKALSDKIKTAVLRIPLRTGINVGTGYLIKRDAGSNIIGNAINLACRIMDVGDENHILLDSKSAEILGSEQSVPRKFLNSLGPVAVKHGLTVEVFSYFDEVRGNPTLPSRIGAATGLKQLSLGRMVEPYEFFRDTDQIDILTNAAPWFSHTEFLNQLERRILEENTHVRVVLIDKDGDYARMRKTSPSYRMVEELGNTVTYSLSLLAGLAGRILKATGSNTGSLQAKVTLEPIHLAIYITSTEAMIGAYSPLTTGSKGLHIIVKRTEGSSIYEWAAKTFDHYFESSKTVIDADPRGGKRS